MKGNEKIEGDFLNKPVALYDVGKQLCFALFDSPTTCAKYVFYGIYKGNDSVAHIACSLRLKSCIKPKSNSIGIKLTLRLATAEQTKLLMNDAAILLQEGYPEIPLNIGTRFHSTRKGLFKEHCLLPFGNDYRSHDDKAKSK